MDIDAQRVAIKERDCYVDISRGCGRIHIRHEIEQVCKVDSGREKQPLGIPVRAKKPHRGREWKANASRHAIVGTRTMFSLGQTSIWSSTGTWCHTNRNRAESAPQVKYVTTMNQVAIPRGIARCRSNANDFTGRQQKYVAISNVVAMPK